MCVYECACVFNLLSAVCWYNTRIRQQLTEEEKSEVGVITKVIFLANPVDTQMLQVRRANSGSSLPSTLKQLRDPPLSS